ncbi:MAG: hypothetical protein JNL21_26310 [Myxococcales bacterium]|nr:hypothetical protein [Myxococcales bacterium]
MTRIALCLLVLPALSACGEGDAPSVEILSAFPDALVPEDDTKDDLTLRVRYEDPTGDLGGGTARVHDCRSASVITELEVPAIANEGAAREGVAISGELELHVTDVGASPSGGRSETCDAAGAEPGAFCVVLVDAAGNESEPDCAEIAVTPGG